MKKKTNAYATQESRTTNNNCQIDHLPPVPQIIMKKIEPTNYQENGKWFISPFLVKTELQKIILHLEQEADAERNNVRVVRPQLEEKEESLHKAILLRKANELNKIVNDQSMEMFINSNLANVYARLGMNKFSIFSYEKVVRILNEKSKRLKYLENIPTNYFSANSKFYSLMLQRYYLHFLRGKTNLALAAACSKSMKHDGAYSFAVQAYLDLIKASHELLIVYLGNLIKFLVQKKYKLKHRATISKNQHLQQEEEKAFVEVEFQNYEFCINFLNDMCEKECSVSHDPKVQMLKSIIEEQRRTVLGYTHYSFENLENKKIQEFIPKKIQKKRFLEVVNERNLIEFSIFNDQEWNKVDVEIDLVYEMAASVVAALYSLSIEEKFMENNSGQPTLTQDQLQLLEELQEIIPARKVKETMKVSKINGGKISQSEHWLSRALELSHCYLYGSAIFKQIKNVYSSSYGNRVEQEAIEEVSEDLEEMLNNDSQTFKEKQKQKEKMDMIGVKWKGESLKRQSMTHDSPRSKNLMIQQKIQMLQESERINGSPPKTAQYRDNGRFRYSINRHQKDNEQIVTLKNGSNLIPLVIRKSNDEDMLKFKQKEKLDEKRERKMFMHSLEVRESHVNEKSASNKKKSRNKNMESLKRIYDLPLPKKERKVFSNHGFEQAAGKSREKQSLGHISKNQYYRFEFKNIRKNQYALDNLK